MPKISVKNADEESSDKLSVEELSSRLKQDITTEPEDETEAENSEEWDDDFAEKNETSTVDEFEPKADEELDKAVEDIEKSDSDELLSNADKKLEAESQPQQPKGLMAKIKYYFKAWWNNKLARWLTLGVLGAILLAFVIVPSMRYFALNTAGVRASASLIVLDQTTLQPLKNVSVSAGGQQSKSNEAGQVFLNDLKLGPTELMIDKTAFAQVNQNLTIGLGSNPLGEYKLTAVGAQYKFLVSDWLSNKPVEKAEATSGESSAVSNLSGEIVLTVDQPENEKVEVEIKLEGYRTEKLIIDSDEKSVQKVSIVPARKHLFVSKRSGKYDLYKIDVDAKNEQLLLAGTGKERDDMSVVGHSSGRVVALVSTREGVSNKDGYLLSGLYIVDVSTGTQNKVTTSERIQLMQWMGDRLIYVTVAEGASASNPKRHRLMSYNLSEDTNKEISATNYFNDILIGAGKIYYAPSNSFNQDPANARLFVIEPDGNGKKTILGQEAWNVLRSSYNTLAIATSTDWYTHKFGDGGAVKASSAPPNQKSRLYVDSSKADKSIWVDSRDGKGVLLEYDIKTATERVLLSRQGLTSPYYWLSDSYIVFRISIDDETADYAISTQGGEAKKIKNVSDIGGVDSWYFY